MRSCSPTSGTPPPLAASPVPLPAELGWGSDTRPPAVHFPGAARGRGLSQGWLSCSVPELTETGAAGRGWSVGTAGVRWIPPRIDLASFPQPDVSSCQSGEQQGQLSLCCSGVSWTPCLAGLIFLAAMARMCPPVLPTLPGLQAWGPAVPSALAPGWLAALLAAPRRSRKLHPAVTERRGCWLPSCAPLAQPRSGGQPQDTATVPKLCAGRPPGPTA